MASAGEIKYWTDGVWFVGCFVNLPGVFSQGKTLDELRENLEEACELMAETHEPPG